MRRRLCISAWLVALATIAVAALAGCAKPSPVLSPTLTATLAVTKTPAPSRTATPTRTPRATSTLVPTLTLRPTRTPTPAPDFAALAWYMMELINRDRTAEGLEPVSWDETAARAGQSHAEEMAAHEYLSHWSLSGYGPEHRYWLAGGRDAVRENVYSFYQRYTNGQGVPIQDWRDAVERAQQTLMDSPGHRENIMQASHTHVGIGIAYEPLRGELRIAQEFVDRYVVLDAVQEAVSRGDVVEISGRMLPGASSPLLNLAYEPFPEPKTAQELNTTSTYSSSAQVYQAVNPRMDGDRFSAKVRLSASEQPGFYHVRVWVAHSGEQIVAGVLILTMR